MRIIIGPSFLWIFSLIGGRIEGFVFVGHVGLCYNFLVYLTFINECVNLVLNGIKASASY